MANTVSSTTKVKIRQAPRIKVNVSDDGALQATPPITLRNVVGDGRALVEMSDVNIVNPANSNILAYVSNTGQWVNRAAPTLWGNTIQFVVANTSDFDYQISLSNTVTIRDALIVGNTFSTNSSYTYIANASITYANVGSAYIANAVIVGGTASVHDIIPDANNVYTIGNTTNRFATLYLSGNTLYMGNVVFEDTSTQLHINDANGNPIALHVGNTSVTGDLNVTQGFSANSLVANTLQINKTANIAANTVIGNNALFIDTVTGRVGINNVSSLAALTVGVGAGGPNSGIRLGEVDLFAFANAGSNRGAPTFRTAIANSQTVLRILPNGVPNSNDYTTQTQFEFFATDYFSNTTNWHNFRIIAQPNRFVIDTARGANTDAPMPIVFDIGGTGSSNATNANYPAVLVLAANGTVGVGTASPDAKFKVQGTANISGNVAVGGTLTVSGNTNFTSNVQVTGTANVTGNLQVTDTITGNNMTLTGNLTVSGTTTYINTTELNVGDNIITLNADVSGTPTENAGIEVNRGTSANVSLIWVEADDVWAVGNTRIAGVATIASDSSIAGATYTGKTFSIIAQDSTGTGLWFSPDGVYMYVVGQSADAVQQYTLATPWDVTTATYTRNFSIVAQDTASTDLYFRADGLKMYVAADTLNAVLEYTLATAWNVSTATYTQQFSIASQEGAIAGLFFKSDGTKMYVVGSGSDAVFQYSLSTPWDISTSTYVSSSASIILQDTSSSALWITADGATMYMMGSSTDAIYQYTLATPWDVSTATYTGSTVYIGHTEQGPLEFFFNESLGKLWVGGSTSDAIREYAITPAADIVANTLVVSASVLRSDATLVVANTAYFVGSGITVYNTTNLGTTSIGGTLTATSTISLSGATTSTTTLGTGATTGTTSIGGTTQTGAVTLGQSTVNSTTNISTGAANSTATKTVNIGTAGLSGSITNINIGSAVSGALGNTTVYSQNFLVGANVIANTSAIFVGNATVNSVLTSSTLTVQGNGYFSSRIGIATQPLANTRLAIDGGTLGGLVVSRQNTYNLSNANVVGGAVAKFIVSPYSAGTNGYISVASIHSPSSNGFTAAENRYFLSSNSTGSYFGGISVVYDTPNLGTESSHSRIFEWSGTSIEMFTANTSRVYVAANGNVGVGTTAPGALFVVNGAGQLGNTAIVGFINVSSTANIGGILTARSDVVVNGALTVANTAALGNTTITGWANVGNLQVADTLTGNNLTLTGNLTVSGTTTYINTTTLDVGDNIITLNADLGGAVAPTENVGIEVNRGSSANVQLIWDETNDYWSLGNTYVNGVATVTANTYLGGASGSESLRVIPQSGANRPIQITGGVAGSLGARLGVASEALDYWTSGGYSHIFATNGPRSAIQFEIASTASAVNYLRATGATTGNAPTISVLGTDTDINVAYQSKGTGNHQFRNGAGATLFTVNSQTTVANYGIFTATAAGTSPLFQVAGSDTNVDLRFRTQGTGAYQFDVGTNNNTQFKITNTASAVNYLQVTGAATGSGPTISAQGTDTDISLNAVAKGTGVVAFYTRGALQGYFTGQTSAVNYAVVSGQTTGNYPSISASGSDTNVGFDIISKAAGPVRLRTGSGGVQFQVVDTASAVNYIQVTGGGSPTISATGSDAYVTLNIQAKSAPIIMSSRTTGRSLMIADTGAPGANYLQIAGYASGSSPVMSAQGSDTNLDIIVTPKGTGVTSSTGPVQVETDTVITTKTLTTTATTADQIIATFAAATYRSAEFIIQATDATGTKYQKTKMLAVHNGTTAEYVEYGNVNVGGDCGTFDVAYSSGIQLRVTPSSTNSTVFKVTCILTKV